MCASRLCSTLLLAAAVAAGCGDSGPAHPEGIGNACSKNDECMTNNCYLGPGGGYCTASCAKEGSTAQCPEWTICKPIQGGPARCLLICGADLYCPAGAKCADDWCPPSSSCVAVSDSTMRACEPRPN